jgi:hypothetical protein
MSFFNHFYFYCRREIEKWLFFKIIKSKIKEMKKK